MLFKDIIGQQEVKQQLVELVGHNRLSHALLFLGKEGSGALPLALVFAQYIGVATNRGSFEEKASSSSLFGDDIPTVNKNLSINY